MNWQFPAKCSLVCSDAVYCIWGVGSKRGAWRQTLIELRSKAYRECMPMPLHYAINIYFIMISQT